MRRFRSEGTSLKINLALDGLPDFKALPGTPGPQHRATMHICPSLAPPGRHIMGIFLQYAPYTLRESNWDELREAFADRVISLTEEYAPNIWSAGGLGALSRTDPRALPVRLRNAPRRRRDRRSRPQRRA